MVGLAEALADFDHSERKAKDGEEGIKQLREDAKFAEVEVERGFPLLHAHSLVGLWGAVEVLFEDVLVAWLVNKPQLLGHSSFRKIRVPGAQFTLLDKEEQMRVLARELQRSQAINQKRGVDRFEALLEPLGIGGTVDKEVKQSILEMYHVRNIIVHCAGVADRRIAEDCPWMKINVGELVPINGQVYSRYSHSLTQYVVSVVHSARRRLSSHRSNKDQA